jgi:hypothetical protein
MFIDDTVIASAIGREGRSVMGSKLMRAGVLTVACMVLATGSARASTVEVKVPFPFVVRGQTLPAGRYSVNDDGGVVQIRGEKGNHAIVYFLTIPADGHDPAGNTPALTFRRDEHQYRLTGIWESASQGRELNR